ncbi:MAG: hypothetical protein AAF725_25290 [Acidobacteriota bacterium]
MTSWGPGTLSALRRAAAARLWRLPFLAAHRAAWFLWRRAAGPRRFTLGGEAFRYLVHPFILDNERAVEIPLALAAYRESERRLAEPRVLEVGNVLRAYCDLGQTVVDRYEVEPGVINLDLLDFHLGETRDPGGSRDAEAEGFDLALSISTVEHIGHDERPREPEKALRALWHLKRLVAPGGLLLVTFPAGYHPGLDRALEEGRLEAEFDVRCLQRVDRLNRWRECTPEETLARSYGSPFSCANGLVVLRYRRPVEDSAPAATSWSGRKAERNSVGG